MLGDPVTFRGHQKPPDAGAPVEGVGFQLRGAHPRQAAVITMLNVRPLVRDSTGGTITTYVRIDSLTGADRRRHCSL